MIIFFERYTKRFIQLKKYHFITFATKSYINYAQNLCKSAIGIGKFDTATIFTYNDIDNDFLEKNKSILSLKRGAGYWLWKPYIINKTLEKINDDDIIFYLDSKYYFIEDFTNLYLDYMKTNDILVWKNRPNESVYHMKKWCKMDVIHKYNMFDKVFNENVEDCWAGALIIKKTEKTIMYMKEWLDMCCDHDDLTDVASTIENSSFFIEHRHDQSMLSIILHKHNIKMHFLENKYLQNVRFPF
jgi:hypothetical protein